VISFLILRDYATLALNSLVELMEVHRHDLVVIMAGYPKELARLLELNPGLKYGEQCFFFFSTFVFFFLLFLTKLF
jgi:hypothetical protein